MELRHLRYFCAVAESLNFTKAAAKLGIAQPPLSKQIKDLEREVGARLFDRSQKRVRLTAAGQCFLPVARNALSSISHGAEVLRRIERGLEGKLRLGFAGSAAYTHVPNVLREFLKQRPGIELTLHEQRTPEQFASLLAGQIDVAIIRARELPDARIKTTVILEEPFLAAIPKSHPLAQKKLAPARELKSQPFVLYPEDNRPGLYRDVIMLCQELGFYPQHAQSAAQIPTILAFVASGLGLALLPASVAARPWPNVTFRPLPASSIKSAIAVSRLKDEQNPAAEALVDCLCRRSRSES